MLIRVSIILFTFICMYLNGMAEVPHFINYQGRLIDDSGEPVADGNYTITFTYYDHPTEVAGHELWTSGEQTVGVVDGLFTYRLGSGKPLPDDLVADTSLWLGVRLFGETEMTPRTQMATVPFAGHAYIADIVGEEGDEWLNEEGDTLTGDLYFGTNGQAGYFGLVGDGCRLNMGDEGKDLAKITANGIGYISLYNSDETFQVILSATAGFGGTLLLYNPNGTNTARLSAGDGSSNLAGNMILYNDDGDYETRMESGGNGGSISFYKNGLYRMRFDAEHDGDESIELMDDAVNHDEIKDEPGIAANLNSNFTELTSTTNVDVATVTISIPGPGYIVVTAKAWGWNGGTTGTAYSRAQIDETAGGQMHFPYYVVWGASSYPATGDYYESINAQRVYYKNAAGDYTFRLEAAQGNTSTGASHYIADPIIIATYYPTSYGSVNTFVSTSEAGDFRNADYESASRTIEGRIETTETNVKVDLSELEAEINALEKELRQKRIEYEEAQGMTNDEDLLTEERR